MTHIKVHTQLIATAIEALAEAANHHHDLYGPYNEYVQLWDQTHDELKRLLEGAQQCPSSSPSTNSPANPTSSSTNSRE